MVFLKQLSIVLLETFLFYIIRLLECRKLEGYAFPVFSTKECPRNHAEWNNRSSAINCTDSNGYMCLPNENFTDLLEFCYIYPRILVQKDLCLYLTKRFSRANSYNCRKFTHGCPSLNYFSDEMYIHHSCSEIEKGCFSAEPNCKRQLVQEGDNPNIRTTVATILGASIPTCVLCILLCYVIRKRNARQQIGKENPDEELLLDNEMDTYQDSRFPESLFEKSIFDRWKLDDSCFISTKVCKRVEKIIKSRNLVIVSGHSGSGKSAIIQHIALRYREQEWTVKIVKKVENIVDECSSNRFRKNKTIFVFNDPLGKESVDELLKNLWQTYEEELKLHLRTSKLLMSCRNHIMSDPSIPRYLVNQSDIIDIDHEMHKLSFEEKRQILTKYTSGMKLSDKDCDEIIQIKERFPLLCRLYSSNEAYKSRGIGFFTEPVTVMKEIISGFRKKDKGKYCALALLVFYNDDLCVSEILENKDTDNKFKYMLKLCGLPENTPPSAIMDNFNSLEDFFVKNVQGTYSFYHDFVMEVTTHVFGTDYPADTIKYADISLHRRKIRIEYSEEPNDPFTICLGPSYKEEFVERVFTELFGDRLMDVVLNPCLMNQSVVEALTKKIQKDAENHLQKLLKKKELEFNKRKYHTKKTLQMSKLDFIGFQKYITPLFVLIVCSHTDVSLVCLDILQRLHANLISSSLLSAVYCNGSMKLFQSFFEDQVNESLTMEWGGLYPVHILSAFHNYEILEELTKIVDNIHSQPSIWDSWTPLLLAAGNDIQINGDYHHEESGATRRDKTIRILLSKGVDINLCDVYGRSPLYVASENGHDSTVELLLKKGANVNLCTKDSASPLYVACENGHDSTVKLLVSKGADINLCAKNGASPLYVASKNGHDSTVELFLRKRAKVNLCTKDSASPLYVACENEHDSTVKLLLSKGANINLCAKNGASPLYVASKNGHDSTVELLLRTGAHINSCTKDSASPLYVACENGHDSTVKLLLSKGADINLCAKNGASPLYVASKNGHDSTVELFLRKGAHINLCTKDSASPLYVACENGHDRTIQLLLSEGAHIDLCAKDGASPLYVASKNGHDSTVKLLLRKGANVNLCTKDSASPLYVACENGHDRTVELLLSKGADINSCSKEKGSPLYGACKNGHDSTVQLLVSSGANVNLCTEDSASPLYVACEKGHDITVELLLSKGAEINSCSKEKGSPLYGACKNGHDSTVQLLVSNGAKVNLCTKDGASPLYVACENGHDSTVELLLSKGADINLCAKNGASPLYGACENGHDSIIQLLVEYGADINLCAEDGASPLYIACENGQEKTVQFLLSKKAYINPRTDDIYSPLSAAFKNGHKGITQLLLNYTPSSKQ